MKFAKKMVAITEDEYNKLRSCKSTKKKRQTKRYQTAPFRLPTQQPRSTSIEGFFHPDYQSKVQNLLNELQQIGVRVTSNRELQLPHGDIIPGSDVVELIKEFLVGATPSRQKPVGWKDFANAVANSNAPIAMISKAGVKNLVKKIRNETINWDEY